MSGGNSFGCNNSVALIVSPAILIDAVQFSVLEMPQFLEVGKVRTPQKINLDRIMLSSGEARSPFSPNNGIMVEELQPFMDFALGVDAKVTARFQFWNAEAYLDRTQLGVSLENHGLAALWEMTRLIF